MIYLFPLGQFIQAAVIPSTLYGSLRWVVWDLINFLKKKSWPVRVEAIGVNPTDLGLLWYRA